MPEGPEVKLSAELISPIVQGRQITGVSTTTNSRYADLLPEGLKEFVGLANTHLLTVQCIATKGKLMYWEFSHDWFMLCTFGMTGQWSPVKGNHPCLVVEHKDPSSATGSQLLYFNDQRHFGTVKFTNDKKVLETKLAELGWDPFQAKPEVWHKYLTAQVQKSNKPIGQLLMDQKLFAGTGNYVRAESLYAAKISPWRLGKKMTANDMLTLMEAIQQVMFDSYNHQGATIQTYKTPYGEEGRYSSCFKVYGQAKDPLGNPIIKEDTPDNRVIHWCPTVQV